MVNPTWIAKLLQVGFKARTGLENEIEAYKLMRSSNLHQRHTQRSWIKHVVIGAVAVVIVAVLVTAGVQLTRPVPAPSFSANVPSTLKTVPNPSTGGIPWPTTGAAGMVVPGVVSFPPVGSKSPLPIASITKVMTALVVLQDHPLSPGQQGPSITITPSDVSEFNLEAAAKDSVVPVTAGEQLSEYQCIEAILVPSADNIAHVLAKWDAGSASAFVAKMKAHAHQGGLTNTHFADTSGLSSSSTSTPSDLLILGQKAMANPIVSAVVAMPSITLPGVPKPMPTYNFALFENGIVGIKTGSDGPAGGCFLFAANVKVNGTIRLAYGVVLGQQNAKSSLDQALKVSVNLLTALHGVLNGVALVHAGQEVGTLKSPDGTSTPLLSSGTVTLIGAPGTTVSTTFHLRRFKPGAPIPARSRVGTLKIQVGSQVKTVGIVSDRSLPAVSSKWKLLNF
ncbi:MAG: D-alanyl-D-alanine carboxypeptidase family protein [Acidimicrobiales bacterium]